MPARESGGFRDEIEAALKLLRDNDVRGEAGETLPDVPLPSLLQQCQEIVGQQAAASPVTVRCLHHFACSGGTVISRCLAAMPNVQLLSEVDPLSRIKEANNWHRFSPTDLIWLSRVSSRPSGDDVAIRLFLSGLDVLVQEARHSGMDLVLRDHPHSKYCSGPVVNQRPTLREIVRSRFETLAAVTIRHPLDSFLAMEALGWRHFQPFDLGEYARRYMVFLDEHEGLPLFRYEDFVDDSQAVMKDICTALDLRFSAEFEPLSEVIVLSGDSGRSSKHIGKRPRRDVPAAIADAREADADYHQLCERLGYAA